LAAPFIIAKTRTWLWLTPQSHAVVKWVNGRQPHSDTLIYLTIYNASKWWQLYPYTYNHIHIQSCSFFYFNSLLLKDISLFIILLVPHVTTNYWAIPPLWEPYFPYRLWALCSPIYYGALCSHCGPCARQLCYYYLLTLSHYYSFNLWFIRQSCQCIDVIVPKLSVYPLV